MVSLKRIKSIIKYAIQMPLYGVSGLIPKNKYVWIFGAWAGETYADNTRYIYEYILEHDKRIKAYWVSKDKDVVRKLLKEHKHAYYYYSIKGYFIAVRASLVFITQTHEDVNFFGCRKAKVVNTWHGIPMKKILFDTEDLFNSKDFGVRVTYRYLPYGNRISSTDYVVCTGPLFEKITKSAFCIDDKHVYKNGYPRNDMFSSSEPEIIKTIREEGKKIIIYLPTHRNYGTKEKSNPLTEEWLKIIDTFLKDNNCVMLYKPHFHEMKRLNELKKLNIFSSIIIPDKDYDFLHNINSFMPFCDILITDYSGAYFDFLLTGKPIIFFCYDLEWYIENTGMYFNYEEITAGPKCYSWDEVFVCVKSMLMGNDQWVDNRMNMRDKVFYYSDNNNAKRAYDFGKNILNL